VEASVSKLPGVCSADVNLFTKRLTVTVEDQQSNEVWHSITKVVQKNEPSAVLLDQMQREEEYADTRKHKSAGAFTDKSEFTLRSAVVPLRIIAALMLLGISYFINQPTRMNIIILTLLAYLISGYDVIYHAIKNTLKGQLFDENFLMAIATIGAFAIGEFPEAVAVMAFYQIGEYFQGRAVDTSRKSIAALMDIRPQTATVIRNSNPFIVSPENVTIGETIRIRPGERIPLDATVSQGNSSIDTKALTGEALPRQVTVGDNLISGCVNLTGLLEATVSKTYGDSTVSKILELVESSAGRKSKTEQFITSFARYYTPIVVVSALVLAFLPPLFIPGATFSIWLYRALVFLVISCPCALVVSVPLGFFAGIGASAKIGVLVKGGNHLHTLSKITKIVFDKTGTLTKGVFSVREIEANTDKGFSSEEVLAYAAAVEKHSNHPIARSIVRAFQGESLNCESIEELSGFGIAALVDGHKVLVGNHALLLAQKIDLGGYAPPENARTYVMVAVDGLLVGRILLADTIRDEAKEALDELKDRGFRQITMLTGDNNIVAKAVAKDIGIDTVHSQLLPQQKVEIIERMLATQTANERLLFVGDGINDAPVIARADVGMAMGALGSDAAIEAADIVIMTDDLRRIGESIDISRKTLRIVKQNIVFALSVKFLVLGLGALGIASMWAAVFADTGVAFLAILNSLRILRVKRNSNTRL